MSPLRSVAGRLALGLLFVVAGVLAIVYLIVVPSYRNALVNTKLSSLEASLRTVGIPNFPSQVYLQQQFASTIAPRVNARVVVYDLLGPAPAPLEPAADSNLDGFSTDVENDPVAFDAVRRQTLARGTVTRHGQTSAEVAYPLGSAVVLLTAPLHDQLQTVSVVRERVFVAGALALAFAVALAYAGASLFARRIKRLEAAADRIAAGRFDEAVIDSRSDELGQLARTFERMRLRLARLDRARGEFIANASHELRTPLFSLGGFLELLDDPTVDAATREEFVAQMREQVTRLTKLATDLLDLSRVDAGRLSVSQEAIDLSELAAEVAAELAPRASRRGDTRSRSRPSRRCRPSATPSGSCRSAGSSSRTPSSTPRAGTTVRVSTALDGGRATLTVANDGPAIPADAQQQIFERFYRLDGTRASGSGLGLAIARELAELMGGRIELDPQNGWTLFTLVLSADGPHSP